MKISKLFGFISSFGCFAAILTYLISDVTQEDIESYTELVDAAKPSEKGSFSQTIEREKSQKLLFVTNQQKERLAIKIDQDSSDLIFFSRSQTSSNKGSMILEKMENVRGFMQEGRFNRQDALDNGLDFDNQYQSIREIEAIKASYDYTQDLFSAPDLLFSRYFCEGDSIFNSLDQNKKLLMQVKGEDVIFSFFEEEPHLIAHQIRSELYPNR